MVRKSKFIEWPSFRRPRFLVSSQTYAETLLRNLHLQVTSHVTRLGKAREGPKVAVYKSRKIAILHAVSHVIPCAISIALLVVNYRGTFTGDVGVTTLTAIQFGAKFLEILIQSSLASIMLSVVRNQVLGKGRIPLGGLLSPFHTTHVSYLWSLPLWGSVASGNIRQWRSLVAAISSLIFIVLAALVGPSTAVLMIPRFFNRPGASFLALLKETGSLFPTRMELSGSHLRNEIEVQKSFSQISSNVVESQFSAQIADDDSIRLIHFPHLKQNDLGMSATLPTNAVVKVLADLLIGTDPAGIYKNDLRADYTLNLEADLIETNTRGFQHSSSAVDIAVAHMPQPYVQMNCVNRSLSGSRNPDSEYISFGLIKQLQILDYPLKKRQSRASDFSRLGDEHVSLGVSVAQLRSMSDYLVKKTFWKDYEDITIYAPDNWTDMGSLTQVPIETLRSGYGYDSSRTPVRLSMAIIGAYSLLVLVFLIYTVVSGQSATSWDSTGELVLLALNSRHPSHLSGTSVGAETLKTFGEPVNTRANKEGSLEMVFADDPDASTSGYEMVTPNKQY